MPKFLEDALRKKYAAEGKSGRALDHAVYGTLNKIGAMHGSKETSKGRAMEAKHDSHPHKNLGKYLHKKKG